MRIFMKELKRMGKMRATWISVAVVLSIVLAFSVFASEKYETIDKDGNIERPTGISAIAVNKEQIAPYEREVMISKRQSDLEVFHNLFDQFIQVSPFSVWSPYLIMGAAAIEIPLFFILAIRAYCKHQVS